MKKYLLFLQDTMIEDAITESTEDEKIIVIEGRQIYKGDSLIIEKERKDFIELSIDSKKINLKEKGIYTNYNIINFPIEVFNKLIKNSIAVIDYVKRDQPVFAKVKEKGIIPSKRLEDGCYDVYACLDDNIDELTILPNEIKMIPTGIASATSVSQRFGLRERGSSGTNGLSYRAGQIDSGWRGEWFVPINNTGNKPIVISKLIGKDIVKKDYAIFYPVTKAIVSVALEDVPLAETQEITYDELKQIPSERGETCLGGSGK